MRLNTHVNLKGDQIFAGRLYPDIAVKADDAFITETEQASGWRVIHQCLPTGVEQFCCMSLLMMSSSASNEMTGE